MYKMLPGAGELGLIWLIWVGPARFMVQALIALIKHNFDV